MNQKYRIEGHGKNYEYEWKNKQIKIIEHNKQKGSMEIKIVYFTLAFVLRFTLSFLVDTLHGSQVFFIER